MGKQGLPVPRDHRAKQVHRGQSARPVRRVLLVPKDRKVTPDLKVLWARLAHKARKDCKAIPVHKGLKAPPVQPARKDRKANKDPKVIQDQKAPPAQPARKDRKANQDHRVKLVQKVPPAQRVRKVLLVLNGMSRSPKAPIRMSPTTPRFRTMRNCCLR